MIMVERNNLNGTKETMFLNLHVDGLMGFFSCNYSAGYLDGVNVDGCMNRFFMANCGHSR
jgi:hypothetical protein